MPTTKAEAPERVWVDIVNGRVWACPDLGRPESRVEYVRSEPAPAGELVSREAAAQVAEAHNENHAYGYKNCGAAIAEEIRALPPLARITAMKPTDTIMELQADTTALSYRLKRALEVLKGENPLNVDQIKEAEASLANCVDGVARIETCMMADCTEPPAHFCDTHVLEVHCPEVARVAEAADAMKQAIIEKVRYFAAKDSLISWDELVTALESITPDCGSPTPAVEALEEILRSGVEFDDPRMDYVVMQVNRAAIKDAKDALAGARVDVPESEQP